MGEEGITISARLVLSSMLLLPCLEEDDTIVPHSFSPLVNALAEDSEQLCSICTGWVECE